MTTRYFTDGTGIETPANPAANDTFTMGCTGLTTTPSATAEYQRLGNMVSLSIPAGLSGTSNSTSFTLTGLPAGIRPTVSRNITRVEVTNGGLAIQGSAIVNTDGTVSLQAGVLGALFSALLGKGVAKQDISWLI